MKVAYADPPYVGMANRYPEKEEVDHAVLIERLMTDFPDGWALSCHSPSLRLLLPMCPEDVRVMAWVKPFCQWKDRSVAYAWEPIIVRGGRKRVKPQDTARDWVSCNVQPKQVVLGQKPEAFCFWLFSVLNLQMGDELVDMFPGSGAVTRAWERWTAQLIPFRDATVSQETLEMAV